ncbi:hypothetical protein Acr_00g0025310 [Actinidia rufa]|uniref:Uncharacterized protein n=1 Tax=Actinidia rufa TaxID=165716 RepID=A0A7J0DDB6_9ERIC|nr:hypothetical protein Acr_00g0025310 [Actinidia rufa]
MKEDRDTTMVRLKEELAELKKGEALAKRRAIEEFKSSDDFQGAVEFTSSKYFGENFDFCKRQLVRLYLNLNIQDMGIDADLLKEEEKKDEENEEEKEREEEKEVLAIKTVNTWRFGRIKTLMTSSCLGESQHKATRRTTGNISSSAQHSMDEVVPPPFMSSTYQSDLPQDQVTRQERLVLDPMVVVLGDLLFVLKLSIPISIGMTNFVPYTIENDIWLVWILLIIWHHLSSREMTYWGKPLAFVTLLSECRHISFYATISSIHIGFVAAWQTILAISILEFCKNSSGILMSKVKSKAEAKLAKISHHPDIFGEVISLHLVHHQLKIVEGI